MGSKLSRTRRHPKTDDDHDAKVNDDEFALLPPASPPPYESSLNAGMLKTMAHHLKTHYTKGVIYQKQIQFFYKVLAVQDCPEEAVLCLCNIVMACENSTSIEVVRERAQELFNLVAE
jgi:hypothetical protein